MGGRYLLRRSYSTVTGALHRPYGRSTHRSAGGARRGRILRRTLQVFQVQRVHAIDDHGVGAGDGFESSPGDGGGGFVIGVEEDVVVGRLNAGSKGPETAHFAAGRSAFRSRVGDDA